MHKCIRVAVFVFLTIISQAVLATPKYSEFSIIRASVDTAGVKVDPYISTLKLGMFVSNQLAIELEYGEGMEDDESKDVTVEIEDHTGIYLRYVGDSSYNGVFFYLIAGSVKTSLNIESAAGNSKETIEDIAYGIGAEERSSSIKNMIYSLEFTRYADKDEGEISGIKLGFRFHF